MINLIVSSIALIVFGSIVYGLRYKNKSKPRAGVKRSCFRDYFNDYLELKLYWSSIAFIFVGSTILLAILIIEIVM